VVRVQVLAEAVVAQQQQEQQPLVGQGVTFPHGLDSLLEQLTKVAAVAVLDGLPLLVELAE
jgi:hypothetical protein